MYEEQIKAAYEAANKAFYEAKALLEKDGATDEDAAQAEKLMDATKAAQAQARRYESMAGLAKDLETPARLPGRPAVDSKAVETGAETKAFDAYLRGGLMGLEPDQRALLHKAAMAEGANNTGGYLVPIQYSNDLVTALTEQSILRAAGAKQITIGSNSYKVPSLTNTTRAVKTSEAGSFNENEPTLGEIVFTPYKYTALVKASDEVLEDSRINLYQDVILPDMAQAFAAGENEDFTVGDGSGDPQGIVTGGTVGVTAAAVAAITADEVIDLYHALGHLYRARATWMMSDTAIKLIRKLKDSNGVYLWQPGLTMGQPDTILGRPLITNNSVAVPAAAAKTVVFGDFNYFLIVDRHGLEIRQLSELYAASGQIGWRAYKRYTSGVLLAAAIQVLQQAAS